MSPGTKHKRKILSAFKTKLFIIAPTSHFKAMAASCAVLAVTSRTITSREESNFLIKLDVNASEEISEEEAKKVEDELKRLGYM